jgi:pyrroloquinoline quinone biosynthesis protein B
MIIHVLGTAQDGGYPHSGCQNLCCSSVWESPELHRLPSSIAAIDQDKKKIYLFDITPNIKDQLYRLKDYNCELAGIFITHAHIGHYLGLMDLGLEIMNTKKIPVYTMPRMRNFILNNQPMTQLIKNNNIELIELQNNQNILFDNLSVIPFEVPHRNELSETVGFRLLASDKSIIFLPDIDDWNSWKVDLAEFVIDNDILFLDGTFYKKNEIKLRDVSKIPHPEIIDTMARLSALSKLDRKRVHFIHLNHTNDALRKNTSAYKNIIKEGFSIAQENQKFKF